MSLPFSQTLLALERPRRLQLALIVSSLVCVLCWLGWSALSSVPIVARSTAGRLEHAGATYPVATELAGRVLEAELHIGQRVAEGDVLLVLDSREEELALAQARAELGAVRSEREAVAAELQTAERRSEAVVIVGGSMLREISSRAAALTPELELARERVAQSRRAGGALSPLEMLTMQSEQESLSRELASRHATRARVRDELIREALAQEAATGQLRTRHQGLSAQIGVLERRLESLEHSVARRTLRAEADGVLADVLPTLRRGAVLSPGDRIATIVSDAPLQVVADFEAGGRAALLSPGQEARIRFDAVPAMRIGTFRARVVRVASETRDGLLRAELSLEGEPPPEALRHHGAALAAEVEIEQVTPLDLALRALGRGMETSESAQTGADG